MYIIFSITTVVAMAITGHTIVADGPVVLIIAGVITTPLALFCALHSLDAERKQP